MIESKSAHHKMGTLVKSCRVLERMNRRGDSRRSDAFYYRILGNYYERICQASEHGDPLALHTIFMPAEILYAMDITPMHAETSTWMNAVFSGNAGAVLEKASEMRLATEICSAHRGLAGSYALNVMPRPDVVLWSALVCDSCGKSGELIMQLTGSPGFFMDYPFEDSEDEKKYLTVEMNKMIAFLEETTGRRMNWDKLSEIVARADYQIQLVREIFELRKAIPSPFPPQRFLEIMMPGYLLPGHPEAIEYMEMLRDEMREMVEQGKGVITEERFRLMTLYFPPLYMIGHLGRVAEEYGAVSVVEPFFNLWGEGRLDPQKPIESLVQKNFMLPEMISYGTFKQRTLDDIVQCARDFKIDGAVFYAHVGCRQAAGSLKHFKDALTDAGYPFLVLDFDMMDATVASEAEVTEKLVQFFELLEER